MMKRLFIAGFVILAAAMAHTQSWVSSVRLSSPEDITYIQARFDTEHNIYLFGSFTGTLSAAGLNDLVSGGDRDYFISKISRSGIPQWMTAIGGKEDEDLSGGMDITAGGIILVAGGFADTLLSAGGDTLLSAGSFDIFLAAYDPDGQELWLKRAVYGEDLQEASSLCTDDEDNLILAGRFRDSTTIEDQFVMDHGDLNNNGFFSKFSSSDGSFIWGETISSIRDPEGVRISEISTGNGLIVLAGSFKDSVIAGTDTLVSLNASEDAFLMTAGSDGKVNWIRTISGSMSEQAQTILVDDSDQIYFSGQYNSPYLKTDTITPDSLYTETNMGGYDLFLGSYSAGGEPGWLLTTGGSGDEKISGSEMFNSSVALSGFYSDTLFWGDSAVYSSGKADNDLFIGYIDSGGGLYKIRTLTGSGISHEESKATFHTGNDTIYSMILSNASFLQVGDDILTSPHSNYHITLGIMGCRSLSVDNVLIQDVETCFGDSTGSLRVFAAGGFGPPYRYSIDGGESFVFQSSLITGLPAGSYDVAIIDSENCPFTGPTVEITEPDQIEVEVITVTDITASSAGLIVVAVIGGTFPYSYTLQPGAITQGVGRFEFLEGDSGTYLVEVIDAQGCGPVATDSITILDLTHVGTVHMPVRGIKIYPNPASGEITIETPLEAEEAVLEILNPAGQVVIEKRTETSGGLMRGTIDISHLEKGIYLIRVNGRILGSGITVL